MDAKSDKILAAAFELVRQHGFRKVTMSDIAEAAGMSRPTLYAAFSNKEAILAGIALRQRTRGDVEIAARLPRARTLEARLAIVFDVSIVAPAASVMDSPHGLDLLANMDTYAPEACDEVYAHFEDHLVALLAPSMKKGAAMSARDLAHIMALATRGLKASTTTANELRRMTDGLIAMAVATAS